MRPIVFECPQTGFEIQAMVDEKLLSPRTVRVPLDCPICQRTHLVDPADFIERGEGNEP